MERGRLLYYEKEYDSLSYEIIQDEDINQMLELFASSCVMLKMSDMNLSFACRRTFEYVLPFDLKDTLLLFEHSFSTKSR